MAEERSRIAFEGGTHNPMAPPFDFIAQTFLPLLGRMGANVSAQLRAPGFYPAGGGRFEVDLVGGICETFSAFGERGIRAESIAHQLAGEVRKYVAANVPVGEHLADQLLIPLALSGAGELRTVTPSLHTRTNAEVIELFLPGRIALEDQGTLIRGTTLR